MNEQNVIWVWNLETLKICRGHKAHLSQAQERPSNDADLQSTNALGGAMCITKKRQVLSVDRNAFVKYCLTSNTYSLFGENFIVKRNAITMMKSSPYNDDMIAFGYRNGLIIIADVAGMFIYFLIPFREIKNRFVHFFFVVQ